MAIEVVQDNTATVSFHPDGSAPASGTATFFEPNGDQISTPTVTVHSIGSGGTSTLTHVDNPTTLRLDNRTGISAGDRLFYTSVRGWSGAVLVSEVYTHGGNEYVVLESPPPGVARVGDTLKGLRLSLTLSATDTKDRGENHRIEYRVTGEDGTVRTYQQIVHVVRVQFHADRICSPTDAARYLSGTFPSYAAALDGGHFDELARRAAQRVLRLLRATGHHAHLVGDQDAFVDCGVIALRIECALTDGLVPGGYDPAIYIETQEKSLAVLMRETVSNMWIDYDDDGRVDEATELNPLFSIDAVRV
tara:strand:- start:8440 stop:9354 length:915 start_codon:yes stop_codon:yes gene_type:complete